jgi:DNA-binding response OmpR family regulator
MKRRGQNNPGFGISLRCLLRWLRSLAQRILGSVDKQTNKPPHLPHDSDGTILLVEVGGYACGSLARLLGQSGHQTQVIQGREAAVDALERQEPGLIIVEGTADLGFYHALRRVSAAPILALAPEGDIGQAEAAFAAGVDQYQAGSISSNEATARVHALLRRAAGPAAGLPHCGTR